MKKIHFEKAAAEGLIKSRGQYIEYINRFSEELKIEGITLTNQILSEFQSQGLEYIARLLVTGAVEQYNNAGIQANSPLIMTLQQNSSVVAARFDQYRLPLQQYSSSAQVAPNAININDNGKAVFTKADEKEIIEAHTVYLAKEDEEIFAKMGEFTETLNEMAEYLKGKKVDPPLHECLGIAYTESPHLIDSNMKLQLRDDTFFLLNEKGAIEVNPAWFGNR